MLIRIKTDSQRYYFIAIGRQSLFKQRMSSLDPIYIRRLFNLWRYSTEALSQLNFGIDEIHDTKEVERIKDFSHVWSHMIGDRDEDSYYLLTLFSLQFSDFIIGLNNLSWFYEYGSTSSTFIMNNTIDASFQSRSNRYHKSTITHRWSDILINNAISLSRTQDTIKRARHRALSLSKFTAKFEQFRRSIVTHVSKLINHLINTLNKIRERSDTI